MSMPGGIQTSRRYTDMAEFRLHEAEMHRNGWVTRSVEEQRARGGAWSHIIRSRRRSQVDVSYVRQDCVSRP